MKLIIFGATGGTGRQLITQALKQGHEVTAFARAPKDLHLVKNESFTIVQGDALNYASVEHAMRGQDVVLCSLGMPNILDKSKLRANATKNIINAMKRVGLKRLICQSGLGAGDSYAILPFYYKYLLVPLIMRNLYADHNLQERHIIKSELDWTIVRPGNLTNGKQIGDYQHGFTAKNKTITLKISRADTAEFMLKQLVNNDYLHMTPSLSY